MKKIIVVLTIIFGFSLTARAEGVDNQLRLLLHGQKTLRGNLGVAGWGIVPDATNPNPRGLLLAGILYKAENRWVEMLGGTFIDGEGTEPLFDMRISERNFQPFEGFLEIGYSPGPDKLLLSPSLVYVTPIHLFGSPIRVGGEADIFVVQGVVSRGVGPRIVFPLPIKGWSVAVAYQSKDAGPNIVRTYISWSF